MRNKPIVYEGLAHIVVREGSVTQYTPVKGGETLPIPPVTPKLSDLIMQYLHKSFWTDSSDLDLHKSVLDYGLCPSSLQNELSKMARKHLLTQVFNGRRAKYLPPERAFSVLNAAAKGNPSLPQNDRLPRVPFVSPEAA